MSRALTITVSQKRMEDLDVLVNAFKDLKGKLPQTTWLKIPTTRGGVASWLVDKGIPGGLESISALILEIDGQGVHHV